MATVDVSCEKAQTIRGLVKECQQAQFETRAQLKSNFARQLPEEPKRAEVPSRPNVLDDIIASLKELNRAQIATIEFLVSEINPKL